MDISKIDKNFAVETKINEPDIQFYDVRKEPFEVYGLYGDIEKNGTPVVYDNKTKECLKQLLVLYNIEYIVQKNKDNDRSYVVFPFDLFKIEKWDIEHVDSFTTNPLTDKAQQKEWLKTAMLLQISFFL